MSDSENKKKGRKPKYTSLDELRQRNTEKAKKYYQENKQKVKEYNKEYYEKNKDTIKEKYHQNHQSNFDKLSKIILEKFEN